MHAIILAAGEGSRLRPFTADKPKPMIRVGNKPIVQHALEALVANGVRDVTVVLGYQRAKVQSHLGDGQRWGARIRYAFQDVLAGTAAALALAPPPDGPFLVLGGDNLVDAAAIKSLLGAPGSGPALVVDRAADPRRYGVVTLRNGQVGALAEKPRDPASEWVNTGLYRFPASFHADVRRAVAEGATGIPEILQARVAAGEPVAAIKNEGLWADAVYPWDLLRIHQAILRHGAARPFHAPGVSAEAPILVGEDVTFGPNVVLGAGTCIGDNVHVGANSVLEGCVLHDDVQVGPLSYLSNAVLGEGARLGPRVTALSGPAGIRTGDGWLDLDEAGAIVGGDARVSGGATLAPGVIVGNRARIAPGRFVAESVPDDARVV